MSRGLPELHELSPIRFLNFVHFMITRNMEQSDREKFRAQLWRPVPGAEIPENSPWSASNEMAAFSSLKAQLG